MKLDPIFSVPGRMPGYNTAGGTAVADDLKTSYWLADHLPMLHSPLPSLLPTSMRKSPNIFSTWKLATWRQIDWTRRLTDLTRISNLGNVCSTVLLLLINGTYGSLVSKGFPFKVHAERVLTSFRCQETTLPLQLFKTQYSRETFRDMYRQLHHRKSKTNSDETSTQSHYPEWLGFLEIEHSRPFYQRKFAQHKSTTCQRQCNLSQTPSDLHEMIFSIKEKHYWKSATVWDPFWW